MKNRLLLLGSELYPFSHFLLHQLPPISLPPKPPFSSTSCPLTPIFPSFSPSCTPTFCKDCHHMFHREILQHIWLQSLWLRYMLGLFGLSNLGNLHHSLLHVHINMAPSPHGPGISAFCLLTSSIHLPLFFTIHSLSKSSSLYNMSPETSSHSSPNNRKTLRTPIQMFLISKPYIKLIVSARLLTVKGERTIL